MAHNAYSAMVDYQDSKEFLNKLEKLKALFDDSFEEKDGIVIFTLSREDYYAIKAALHKSCNIVCSYKDTIAKMMANTELPDTLV